MSYFSFLPLKKPRITVADWVSLARPKKVKFPMELLKGLPKGENSVICPLGIKTMLSVAANGHIGIGRHDILKTFEEKNTRELSSTLESALLYNGMCFTSNSLIEVPDSVRLSGTFKQAARKCRALLGRSTDNIIKLQNTADFYGAKRQDLLPNVEGEPLQIFSDGSMSKCVFHNANGTVTSPEFVEIAASSFIIPVYYDETGIRAITIPYLTCGRDFNLFFTIVLVEENIERIDLPSIFNRLTPQWLIRPFLPCNGMLGTRGARVVFPKFEIKNEWDSKKLKEILKKAGLGDCLNWRVGSFFGAASKTFGNMEIIQKTTIKMDEAKAKDVYNKALKTDFVVDHPFWFFIHGTEKNEILFEGIVNHCEDAK